MTTPIYDFVKKYADSNTLRCHVPGHKGADILGCERLDITEMSGADSLYEAEGIIRQSEENASFLFGCNTLYSTEGSSHCIRAMVYLAKTDALSKGKKPLIAAGRNAHKSFLTAAALTDTEVEWIYPEKGGSYLSCPISPRDILSLSESVTAVYITSPDYLGNRADIKEIAEACNKRDMLLLVDNAHGAYLKFLPMSEHPMDLGAHMCCDSAHKTLSVLTGGAYLHIKDKSVAEKGKRALSIFGSTSPSYLILQSLDIMNKRLGEDYRQKLSHTALQVAKLKAELINKGYSLKGDEPLKITVETKKYGYTGNAFADLLRLKGVEVEFSDPDLAVMMITTETTDNDINYLSKTLGEIEKKEEIKAQPPKIYCGEKKVSIKDALLSPWETVSVKKAEGRILADAGVGCPPAVPIAVCGEVISSEAIEAFEYYGIEEINVLR